MPDGLTIAPVRDDDPFGWAMELAGRLRRRRELAASDRNALSDFLEEWADEMLAAVRSQLVNLLAHAAKVANTRNPDVVGHWRSECVEFHDRLIDVYRPSMRDKLEIAALWRRAHRKVVASFRDHAEPLPQWTAQCPVSLDDLLDPELDFDRLIAVIRDA